MRTCVIFNPTAKGEKARRFRRHLDEIVCDASEKVSGNRRTDPLLQPRLTKLVDDPRPPMILAKPWQIYWTGLPNSTTGEARALLDLPACSGGPAPIGYYLWQGNWWLGCTLEGDSADGALP